MSENGWMECKLGDIADIICGATPSTTNSDYWADEILWVTAKDISENRGYKIFDTERKISEAGFKNCSTVLLPEHTTVLIARGATMGKVCLLAVPMALNQTCYAIIGHKDITDKFYLFYSIKKMFQYFESISHGAIFNTIIGSSLKETPFFLPPLLEQRTIASVLSSLDDKINLLHRQNKTLEAMVETLFRQWFVEAADERWEEGKIGDLFILQRGYDLPIQDRIDGQFPIISSSGINGNHFEFKVKAPGVVTGRSGLLGNVFYVMENFWPLNTTLYIKDYKIATPLYGYFFLRTLDLSLYNAGSAVPTLNRNHVHEQETIIPPKALIMKFETFAVNIFKKIENNNNQIHTLEKLRDTLLPKLMNGEVRVEV
jgi:type I restriction enzyme S subunit